MNQQEVTKTRTIKEGMLTRIEDLQYIIPLQGDISNQFSSANRETLVAKSQITIDLNKKAHFQVILKHCS